MVNRSTHHQNKRFYWNLWAQATTQAVSQPRSTPTYLTFVFRLDDGTLVADSLATPEGLAARVASKFRYGGSKLAMLFESECESTLGARGITAMTSHGRCGGPEDSGALQSAARQAGYAPAAAGWIGEVSAASLAGGKKRVAPLLTYHYLPPSSSSGRSASDNKKGP